MAYRVKLFSLLMLPLLLKLGHLTFGGTPAAGDPPPHAVSSAVWPSESYGDQNPHRVRGFHVRQPLGEVDANGNTCYGRLSRLPSGVQVCGPLEANDPALGSREFVVVLPSGAGIQAGQVLAVEPVDPSVHPDVYGDPPTPLPPQPPGFDANLGTPGDLDPHPIQARSDQPVSFHTAIGVYLHSMTWVQRDEDGLPKLVVHCAATSKLSGPAATLAPYLPHQELAATFGPIMRAYRSWLMENERVTSEWNKDELTLGWWSYADQWMQEDAGSFAIEPLRPLLADAAIGAGLPRAEDLLVTPTASLIHTPMTECVTCTPPLVCSCQHYNDSTEDCENTSSDSCTVIEQTLKSRLRSSF